jgi:hypothetical protein
MKKMKDLPCISCIHGLNCEYRSRFNEMIPRIDEVLHNNNDSRYYPFTISLRCNRYCGINTIKWIADDSLYNDE